MLTWESDLVNMRFLEEVTSSSGGISFGFSIDSFLDRFDIVLILGLAPLLGIGGRGFVALGNETLPSVDLWLSKT